MEWMIALVQAPGLLKKGSEQSKSFLMQGYQCQVRIHGERLEDAG